MRRRKSIRQQEGKDTFFFYFGGRFLDCSCSALCFFPLPFTVVKEPWQPVLPVYTSQKQAKKPTWWSEPWPSNMHAAWCFAAHLSLHHLHVDLRKLQGRWLLLSFWGSQKRHRRCVTREKNYFPFVLGMTAESPESSSRSYLQLRRSRRNDRRSIRVTGSEDGGTVSAVDCECNRQ